MKGGSSGDYLQNAVEIKGRIYKSSHRHDFVTVHLPGGEKGFIDGGNAYIRWSLNVHEALDKGHGESLVVKKTDSLEYRAHKMVWGTRGKDGKESFHWKRLKDCTTNHLKAILEIQRNIRPDIHECIEFLLKGREVDAT